MPVPRSWFPHEHAGGINDVANLINRWPVLVKPSVGVGARGIVWCQDADELRGRFVDVEREHGESFVQGFVPFGAKQYKVDMLTDAQQCSLAEIVYGKARMYPPEGGSSVLNFSATRPDIVDYAHKMLLELRWVGFSDFDFVDDPRDGIAKLLEINPRFPESLRMGTSVGIDFPMMLYRLAHGEPVTPVIDYPRNRFLRFLPADLLWFLRVDNDRRFGARPSWFAFLDGRTAYQVCSARDFGPIMAYVLENLLTVFDPRLSRERLRLDSGRGSKPCSA